MLQEMQEVYAYVYGKYVRNPDLWVRRIRPVHQDSAHGSYPKDVD